MYYKEDIFVTFCNIFGFTDYSLFFFIIPMLLLLGLITLKRKLLGNIILGFVLFAILVTNTKLKQTIEYILMDHVIIVQVITLLSLLLIVYSLVLIDIEKKEKQFIKHILNVFSKVSKNSLQFLLFILKELCFNNIPILRKNKHSLYKKNSNFRNKHIVAIITVNNTLILTRSCKRTMLTRAAQQIGKVTFEGKPFFQQRNFATFASVLRLKQSIKSAYPDIIYDNDGKIIMPIMDHSGSNHYLLAQIDCNDPNYVWMFGSFTTSYSKYLGKYPLKIDVRDFFGGNKYQYFHLYDAPRKLRRDSCEIDAVTTVMLTLSPYQSLIEQIKKQHNIP